MTHEPSRHRLALTPRQEEILALWRRRFTAREIGEKLGLSARTVESHIESIYRKLGIRSRVELGGEG